MLAKFNIKISIKKLIFDPNDLFNYMHNETDYSSKINQPNRDKN